MQLCSATKYKCNTHQSKHKPAYKDGRIHKYGQVTDKFFKLPNRWCQNNCKITTWQLLLHIPLIHSYQQIGNKTGVSLNLDIFQIPKPEFSDS